MASGSTTQPPLEARPANLLLTACAISFFCFFGSYLRIPVAPLFAVSLGADSVQVGLINASFMLMAGLLSIPCGLLSDRFGRRLPLLGGMLLLSSSSFLLALCHTPLQMGLVYLLFGVGLAAFSPTLMSYVADVTPPHRLGQAYGWYTMAVYGGMTVGPAAGGYLASVVGLRQVFPVSGVMILLMCPVALFLVRPAAALPPRRTTQFLPALAALRGNRPFLASLAATIGTCFGFGTFVTFMPLYLRSLEMDSRVVGVVFAAQALVNALSRVPSGRLGDRCSDRSRLVALGVALFALAMALFSLCRGVASLVACAAFMGGSMALAFTAIGALIAESVPGELRGIAMGSYNSCIYVGMMVSSTTMGGVVERAGFPQAFLLTGLVAVLVLGLFVALMRPSPRQGEGDYGNGIS